MCSQLLALVTEEHTAMDALRVAFELSEWSLLVASVPQGKHGSLTPCTTATS